jgi:hypothetical protein
MANAQAREELVLSLETTIYLVESSNRFGHLDSRIVRNSLILLTESRPIIKLASQKQFQNCVAIPNHQPNGNRKNPSMANVDTGWSRRRTPVACEQ